MPGIPVVVVGRFASDARQRFVSNSIFMKHSQTYIAAYPSRVKVSTSGQVC